MGLPTSQYCFNPCSNFSIFLRLHHQCIAFTVLCYLLAGKRKVFSYLAFDFHYTAALPVLTQKHQHSQFPNTAKNPNALLVCCVLPENILEFLLYAASTNIYIFLLTSFSLKSNKQKCKLTFYY